MAVTYRAFTDERTQLRVLVEFLEAQERDHYVHSQNKDRCDAMLLTLPDGPYKTRVQKLLADVTAKIAETEAIIDATQAQLPPNGEVDQIMAEILAERAAKKAK